MRKGQPERMCKLQKTILWELQYDEAVNVLKCQIAITELGEMVVLKCFTNKKIYSLYPLGIAARTCEWSPTQLRRFKTISVFAPELLELFDVQLG
jgi:hypothetical protein